MIKMKRFDQDKWQRELQIVELKGKYQREKLELELKNIQLQGSNDREKREREMQEERYKQLMKQIELEKIKTDEDNRAFEQKMAEKQRHFDELRRSSRQ